MDWLFDFSLPAIILSPKTWRVSTGSSRLINIWASIITDIIIEVTVHIGEDWNWHEISRQSCKTKLVIDFNSITNLERCKFRVFDILDHAFREFFCTRLTRWEKAHQLWIATIDCAVYICALNVNLIRDIFWRYQLVLLWISFSIEAAKQVAMAPTFCSQLLFPDFVLINSTILDGSTCPMSDQLKHKTNLLFIFFLKRIFTDGVRNS